MTSTSLLIDMLHKVKRNPALSATEKHTIHTAINVLDTVHLLVKDCEVADKDLDYFLRERLGELQSEIAAAEQEGQSKG